MPRPVEQSSYAEFAQPERIGLMSAAFSRHSFVPHAHETYSLGVIQRGAARSEFNGRICVAPVGSVISMNPGDVHTGEPAEVETGWQYQILYPSVDLVNRMADEILGVTQSRVRLASPVLFDPVLADQLSRVCVALEHQGSTASVDVLLKVAFTRLFRFHLTTLPALPAAAEEHWAVVRAKEYMVARFRSKVTLSDIASHVALSKFHLARLFRNHTGMSPYSWLEHVRITHAVEALRAGESISDVAADTGFCDQAHLSRRFKRVIGVPPARYARAVRRCTSH